MTENNKGWGITDWDNVDDVKTNNNGKFDDDVEFLPFMKTSDGDNEFRLVSPPAEYNYVELRTGKKYPERVNTSFPKVKKEECPLASRGLYVKKRYLAIVLNRKNGKLECLDMSKSVGRQIKAYKKNSKWGDPLKYDLNLQRDSTQTPAKFYNLQAMPPEPLSEADLKLIEENKEAIRATLMVRTTPPSPEAVLRRIEKLGIDLDEQVRLEEEAQKKMREEREAKKAAAEKAEESDSGSLEAADDDDYSFDQPAAQA